MDVTTGLFGLIVASLDLLAIFRTVQSGASTLEKFFWIVVILLLPVVGFGLWYFLGPK